MNMLDQWKFWMVMEKGLRGRSIEFGTNVNCLGKIRK